MTTTVAPRTVSYAENGATVAFPVPFKFLANAHVKALRRDAAGVETELVTGTDYSVTGAGDPDGGTLTVTAAAASGITLVIWSETARGQEANYATGDTFPAETHEGALDRLDLVDQELEGEIDRAPKVPRGETPPVLLLNGLAEGDSLVADADGNLIPSGESAYAAQLQEIVDGGVAAQAAIDLALAALIAGGGYAYDAVTGLRRKWDGSGWAIAPDVFLDPVNGNDSWDGSRRYHDGGIRGPKKTRQGVEAHAAMVANAADGTPVCIGLVFNATVWRGGFDYFTASSRNGNATRDKVHLVAVGGPFVRVSCCDLINKATISAHGSIANAYTMTVPHEMLDASGTNFTSVFVDGERLQYRNTEAECSNAGTWYAASNGAATPGVDLAITFHLPGSVAPAAVGDIEVTTRTTAFAGQNHCHVEGIWGIGSGNNNGSIVINNNGRKVRCVMEEGTKHNGYQGAGSSSIDCMYINCARSDDERAGAMAYGGGLAVAFGSGTGFVNGMDAEYVRCGVIIDNSYMTASDGGAGGSSPWYSHADSGYLGTLTYTDCWDSGCSRGGGSQAAAAVLRGYTSFSDFGSNTNVFGMASATAPLTVEDSFFFGSCNQSMFSQGNVTVRRSMIAGNYNWLAFITPNLVWTDNVMVAVPSGDNDQKVAQLNPTTIESVVITNNVFVGVYIPYVLDYGSAAAPDHSKLVIDRNLYVVAPDGGMNYNMATISGANKTMAQWQALGEDVNSVLIETSDTAAIDALFLTGTRPTAITLDARLDPAGQGADYVRFLPSETAWQRAVGRPRTRAAAAVYLAALARDAVWQEAA